MIRRLSSILVLACLLGAHAPAASACTAFTVEKGGDVLVGRNYDWNVPDALVMVNKRGVTKPVLVEPTAEVAAATWTSRYGSVTFNQYGRDLPQGGMNERGLVVEVLWLDGTVYPREDERTAVGCVQWIQYQLDTAASVDEVIDSLERVRVASSVTVHYFVADASGATAAVEYLDGEAVVHRSVSGANVAPAEERPSEPLMDVRVLTNDTYGASVSFLRRFAAWGGSEPLPRFGSPASLSRFVQVATEVRRLEREGGGATVEDAFRVLRGVSRGEWTQWQIVYDLGGARVHFRTASSFPIKTIDFASLDFSCATPVRIVDIDIREPGDAAGRLRDYTTEANRALIERSYAATEFLKDVPPADIEQLARVPERSRCAD